MTNLLGYKIEVHTKHKKLGHKTFSMSSDYIIQWCLIVEEYDPEICCVLGLNSIVADTLSRLPKINAVERKQMFSHNAHNVYVWINDQSEEFLLDIELIS